MKPFLDPGKWVVVDGVLKVTVVRYLGDTDSYIVESGHGSFVVKADRVEALA